MRRAVAYERLTILILAIAGLVAGCALRSYMTYRISPDYPRDTPGRLEIHGLERPVHVHFDDFGIPHIDAENEHDLMRAVGFVQARARFFQMDTLRRYAYGRLCELFGEQPIRLGTTLNLDLSMRSWDFERASQSAANALDGETRRLMRAYADGVNAAARIYEPVEYALLGTKPEPWCVADTFAVSCMISWGVAHNWRHELCRLLLAMDLGHERAHRIFPAEPWPASTSIETPAAPRPLPPSVVPELYELFPERLPEGRSTAPRQGRSVRTGVVPDYGGASNGWVVGGERTNSGMPVLAGDPHLPHTLPSLGFQQHLRCPGLDVIGMTVPGIPFVLLGHNGRVAWTVTSATADMQDLYIERRAPDDPHGVIGPDGPEPLSSEPVVVRIRQRRGCHEKTVHVRRTPRGPLLNDIYPDLFPAGSPLVAIRAVPLGGRSSIEGFRRAARATSVRELHQAMQGIRSPVSIVSAADTTGAVAQFSTGTVPVRRNHRGTFPVPAWSQKYQWKSMAAPAALPIRFGGSGDYYVHANNLTLDPRRSPVIFHVDSAPSYRHDRVVELIEARTDHDAESIAAMQGDLVSLRARHLVPIMLGDLRGAYDRSPREAGLLGVLEEWNYRSDPDSVACALFSATYRQAMIEALSDEVDIAALDFLLSFRYFTNATDQWFADARHPVWDDRTTTTRETRSDVLRKGFASAVEWLDVTLGADTEQWSWGRLHYVDMVHPFGGKLAAFNLPRLELPGADATIRMSIADFSDDSAPFSERFGPVMRMVIDLADIEHAWWAISTGSSGWPMSPHYEDQVKSFMRGKLVPMVSAWEEIREEGGEPLLLE